jgi:signal transduction histidine kinase
VTLRRQLIILIVTTAVVLFLALGAVFQFILVRNYADLEKQEVAENVKRVYAIFRRESSVLGDLVADWAAWDDTYNFARGESPTYPSENFMDETFTNMKINLIAIYDPSGRLLVGRSWDLINNREAPLPDRFKALTPGDRLLTHQSANNAVNGLVRMDTGVMVVSAQPVTTSLRDKPAMGVLIMGRTLSPPVLTRMSSETLLNFNAYPLGGQLPADLADKMAELSKRDLIIEARDADSVFAYTLYPDITGQPTLFLVYEETRDIVKEGARTIVTIGLILALGLLTTGFVAVYMTNRYLIRPLSQLSTETARIGRDHDWTGRIPISYRNEVGTLAGSINGMLDELVLTRSREQQSATKEKQARERAENEIRKRSDYTRALVHELKTPLTAIIASIELLSEDVKGEGPQRLIRNIARGAANLNKRIDELLDMAKGEVGILGINPAPLDARQLVMDVVSELSSIAHEKGQSLTLSVPDRMLPAVLDGARLRQVLTNLVGNALKFTPEGGVIRVTTGTNDGNLIIEVADSGPGIPPEELPNIFEPYHRLSTMRGRLSGMGVGLALSRMLVNLHGGQLTVTSTPGTGSIFTASLPLVGARPANGLTPT